MRLAVTFAHTSEERPTHEPMRVHVRDLIKNEIREAGNWEDAREVSRAKKVFPSPRLKRSAYGYL